MKKRIKVMTFNTQHCRNLLTKKIDYEIMADTIKKCEASIVGLNEMRAKGEHSEYENQVNRLSSLTDLGHSFFAKAIDDRGKNPYGNGLLSDFPIMEAKVIPVPDSVPDERNEYYKYYETRCLLKVKLEGGITLLIIHFGLNPDEQEKAVETVISNLEDERCILMGDFNVEPDNKVLAPVRERMKDTADKFEKTLYSFTSDNPTRKIDYIFVSKDIEVISADIPQIIASDHFPYIAEIEINTI